MEKLAGRDRKKIKDLFKNAPVGPFLFYLSISTLSIMALATIILTIIFLPISSKGSVRADLDSLALGINPKVSNFKEMQFVGNSEEIELVAHGVFEFYCSSITVLYENPTTEDRIERTFESKRFELSTHNVDGFTYFTCPDNNGAVKFTISEYLSNYIAYPYGFINFSDPQLIFTTLESERSVISISGGHSADYEEKSTVSGAFTIKSGTKVTFDTPALITIPYREYPSDPDRLPYACYEVFEIVFNDDCEGEMILEASTLSDHEDDYLYRYEDISVWRNKDTSERRISFITLGDTQDYSLTVVNAEEINATGSGTFTYSKNSSNEACEIYSQSIDVKGGECNLFYKKQDGAESLRIDGAVKKLLVSGKSVHLNFFNWLHNNIGIVPTALLTIIGGAITISLKLVDKYSEKEENDMSRDEVLGSRDNKRNTVAAKGESDEQSQESCEVDLASPDESTEVEDSSKIPKQE